VPTVDLAVTLAHIRQHCRGREQARKVRDIAAALGLRETQVRLAAQELRNQGYPICATFRQPAGYFWPETPEEIRGALEELRARRDSLSHTIGCWSGGSRSSSRRGRHECGPVRCRGSGRQSWRCRRALPPGSGTRSGENPSAALVLRGWRRRNPRPGGAP